jgi:hypothetical protein
LLVLRQNIGLLGVGIARTFLFVDRLVGELRDARDSPVATALKDIYYAYDAAGDVLGLARNQFPRKDRGQIREPTNVKDRAG